MRLLGIWLLTLAVLAPACAQDLQDLLKAVQEGYLEPVTRLLEQKPALVHERDRRGANALYEAVYMNRPEIANLLIARGADVNVVTERKTVPMHAAARRNSPELCTLLLANGAAVDPLEWRGHSPLHFAVLAAIVDDKGDRGTIPLLLDKGADVNRPQGDTALTPLHMAAAAGRLKLVTLLLDRGAQVNPVARGWTPLGLAQRYKLREWDKVAALLKSKGGLETPPAAP